MKIVYPSCKQESRFEYKTRLPRATGSPDKKKLFSRRRGGRTRSGQAARGEWGNQPTDRHEGERKDGPLSISGEEHSTVVGGYSDSRQSDHDRFCLPYNENECIE